MILPFQRPPGQDSPRDQNERAVLSQIGEFSGAAMLDGNGSDFQPAARLALEIFFCLLEADHFDADSFSGQCFGGSAGSWVPGISGIHDSDGAFASQMQRNDIGRAELWTAVGQRLHALDWVGSIELLG